MKERVRKIEAESGQMRSGSPLREPVFYLELDLFESFVGTSHQLRNSPFCATVQQTGASTATNQGKDLRAETCAKPNSTSLGLFSHSCV
jgi:hypothetical protein